MDTFKTVAENTEFEWQEMERPNMSHIKDAWPGDVFTCVELNRRFIREKNYFIIEPRTYLGTSTIRGSIEFVEALIGDKFCLVVHGIFIE